MVRLRKLQRLAASLVAMFLIAQFAGVVPRTAVAQPGAAAGASSLSSHQHARNHVDHEKACHQKADDQHGNIADQCCALHLLAGVVPPVMVAIPADLASSALALTLTESDAGLAAAPPYRPPRSLAR